MLFWYLFNSSGLVNSALLNSSVEAVLLYPLPLPSTNLPLPKCLSIVPLFTNPFGFLTSASAPKSSRHANL